MRDELGRVNHSALKARNKLRHGWDLPINIRVALLALLDPGGMAERFNAPVLKTGDPQGSVGSNPTPSARLIFNDLQIIGT
jgi:hypothetical protein